MISGLVSIIVPVFNTRKYVKRAVDSLIKQTSRCVEIIIVDDGSTDDSGNICDELALADNRIQVFHQINRGVSAARNAGLVHANGEYIIFVDSDDEMPEDAVHNFLNAAQNAEGGLVIGGYFLIKDAKKRFYSFTCANYRNFEFANEIVNDELSVLVKCSACGKLFRTEIIRKNNITFNEDFVMGEDALFIGEYLRFAKNVLNVFSPQYIVHRFPSDEKIHLEYNIFPDFFEYHCIQKTVLWDILRDNTSEMEQHKFLEAFCNELVIHLVRAGAYHDFFAAGEFYAKMKELLKIPLVQQSASIYKRRKITDSILIPFFLRYRQPRLLCIAMKIRGRAYIKARGKSRFVKSIYRIDK